MNLLIVVTLAATLNFPAALERAMRSRAAATTYDERAKTLEALPFRTLPVIRAETGISTAENLNLLNQNVGRIDAFTALVNVDYPLFNRGAEERRLLGIRADAQILRRRALDEAEDVFRETLEAFADLYVTEQRITMLTDGARRAAMLRQRARTMLDAGQISNITAAQWEDQALSTESQLVELELARLEAETRLKQVIGDTSGETLHASLEIVDEPMLKEIRVERIVEQDAAVARASLVEQRKRLALQEATALHRPQVMLSAFGGMAAVPSSFQSNVEEGTFGIYGLRLSMTFPLLDTAAARRLAEARIEAEEASRVRDLTATATRNRFDLLWLAVAAADRRIELLSEAVKVARQRQESVSRLVTAGVGPESDLVDAAAHVAKRESDLLAVRVDRWKLQQRVKWGAQTGTLEQRVSSPIGGQ